MTTLAYKVNKMWSIIKPIIFGVISSVTVMLMLWVLLSVAFKINMGSWYPFLVMVPSLIVGGFVSSTQIRSRFLSRYLLVGATVGVILLFVALFLTQGSGKMWFWLLVMIVCGLLSSFGAFLGASKWQIKK